MANDRMTQGRRNEDKVILVPSVLAIANDRMTMDTQNEDRVIFRGERVHSGTNLFAS